MRGKVPLVTSIAIVIGITPAYAGKRDSGKQQGRRKRDHPRLCGEKNSSSVFLMLSKRITPAYAGKSSKRGRCGKLVRDHPRLCGEKHQIILHRNFHLGSPPPMRGKVCMYTNVL